MNRQADFDGNASVLRSVLILIAVFVVGACGFVVAGWLMLSEPPLHTHPEPTPIEQDDLNSTTFDRVWPSGWKLEIGTEQNQADIIFSICDSDFFEPVFLVNGKSEVYWRGRLIMAELEFTPLGKEIDKLVIASRAAPIDTSQSGPKGRCPECRKLGLRSTVTMGMGMVDAVYRPIWWDEDGRIQSGGGSSYVTSYSCSQGHYWAESN